ncbi:MAG: DUF6279 family lipoprotein [Burkholderiales bacterium]
MNWRGLVAVLAALLLSACSAIQVGYRNADTFLRWQANSYFDFEGEQSAELEGRIASFLAWHRSSALPRYRAILEEAAARTGRGLAREDLQWGYDAVRAQIDEALRAAAAEAAPLLDRLPAGKITHLERRLAEDNRKFARRFLAGTSEERRERRLKRNLERLEDWLGGLTDAQVARVRQYANRTPLSAELRDRDRKRRQAEFVTMLRKREAGRRLSDWSVEWERSRAPEHAAATREQLAAYFDLLLELDRMLSPEQRAHAVNRLRFYADSARVLARAPERK